MGLLDMTPQQYGLLAAGLGMMQNSRGKSLGEALGAGGMQGINAITEMQQQQQLQALHQAQMERYQAQAAQENERLQLERDKRNAMKGIDVNGTTDDIVSKLAAIDPEAAIKWKLSQEKTPDWKEKALFAAGGDENTARELTKNSMQNPFQALSYNLNASNTAQDNARANEQLRLQQEAAARAEEEARIKREQASREKLKDIPVKQFDAYMGNNEGIRKIDEALATVENNPDSFGLQNLLPDMIIQRTDEKGVTPRAKVSEIGAQKFHDISGAAISASEAPRLLPFIPTPKDSAKTVKEKLLNLRKEYDNNNNQIKQLFNPTNGFKAFPELSPVTAPLPRVGDVVDGHVYVGGDPSKPDSWRAK